MLVFNTDTKKITPIPTKQHTPRDSNVGTYPPVALPAYDNRHLQVSVNPAQAYLDYMIHRQHVSVYIPKSFLIILRHSLCAADRRLVRQIVCRPHTISE